MRITNAEKLKMVLEHLKDGKSLSHISERYGNYYTGRLKYLVNLYKNIRYQIINADIKRHTEVDLYYSANSKVFIIYNDKKYNLKSIKKVNFRTGLTKYY